MKFWPREYKIILAMKIKLAIFDLDGTVVENDYDWQAIRKELGVEVGSILAYLDSLPEPVRSEKYALLEAHEKQQTEKAVVKEGMRELLGFLQEKRIKKALVTNNSAENVNYLLGKFELEFDLVLTRESGLHKPAGAPFRAVIEQFKASPEETLVVGDTNYDLLAAKESGISRVFILKSQMTPAVMDGEEIVSSVTELTRIIERLLG